MKCFGLDPSPVRTVQSSRPWYRTIELYVGIKYVHDEVHDGAVAWTSRAHRRAPVLWPIAQWLATSWQVAGR